MSKRGGPEGLAAALPLTKADFQSDQETRWCPGCGDYSVLAAIQGFMPELGIAPEKIVFVTGIGCAGRFAYYMNTYGMHAIHGRAPAIATGLAAARDDLSVWVVSGDGDALSIGTNHLVHALRRNIPVKILLFNNRIYGLTKGQTSPTSEYGKVTKSTPSGSIDPPLDALSLALGAGATFVARTVDRDKKGLVDVLRAAARHRGAAFVEVLQDCPVFNDGTFDHLTDRDQADANRYARSTARCGATAWWRNCARRANRSARPTSRRCCTRATPGRSPTAESVRSAMVGSRTWWASALGGSRY
jgi:2-oxoglutarate ferredoxin oxidoreductase subunit beta